MHWILLLLATALFIFAVSTLLTFAEDSVDLSHPGSYYINDFYCIDSAQNMSIYLSFFIGAVAALYVRGLNTDCLATGLLFSATLLPIMTAFASVIVLIEFASRMSVDYVAKKGYHFRFSEGVSMWPASGYYNLHIMKRVTKSNYKDLKVGDVVVYVDPRFPVGIRHRICSMSKKKGCLVVKGDANATDDGPIKFSQIVAIDTRLRISFGRVCHLYLAPRLILRRLYRWIRFKENLLKRPRTLEYYYSHTMADYIE